MAGCEKAGKSIPVDDNVSKVGRQAADHRRRNGIQFH